MRGAETHPRAGRQGAAVCDFGRQRFGDIEPRAGFEFLIENKIETTRGHISGLALLRVGQALGWDANDYRQRQVITSSGTTLRHYTHPPLRPRSHWEATAPLSLRF